MDPQLFRDRALAKTGRSQSKLAFLFTALARCSALRSYAILAVCRLEGGQMWSKTYRRLMKKYYDVEIGAYSYGSSLFPGRLPPGTTIGNYCSVADGFLVFRRNHPVDRISQHPFFYSAQEGLLDSDSVPPSCENPLHIGHDVWVGQNVLVTAGCKHIGDGAVVAAGAVVTTDVESLTVVGGVPAKFLRLRFPKQLHPAWRQSQWWMKQVHVVADDVNDYLSPYHSGQLSRSMPECSAR